MKIVAIVGSPRIDGNTSYLVDQALEEAATCGIEAERILLIQHRVNPCLGHENCASFSTCKQDDDAPWILDKFSSADGVILGSPVYYYNMSAQLKAFVDRNYFFYTHGIRLRALCAGLIVVGGGGGTDHAARALKRFLEPSADIPKDRIITVMGYAGKPGDVKNNRALVEEARILGRRLAEILTEPRTSKST